METHHAEQISWRCKMRGMQVDQAFSSWFNIKTAMVEQNCTHQLNCFLTVSSKLLQTLERPASIQLEVNDDSN
jgi:succinate dehydrogenase flavin-adding protein (antitoxin of CptAB toxin-antitoxin module)